QRELGLDHCALRGRASNRRAPSSMDVRDPVPDRHDLLCPPPLLEVKNQPTTANMKAEQPRVWGGQRKRLRHDFRKACPGRFRLHLPHLQRLRKNPRTCLEGPFGEVIRATGPMAKANPFRFSTKYQDDETDLLYYGYRYYNPAMGRWLSR